MRPLELHGRDGAVPESLHSAPWRWRWVCETESISPLPLCFLRWRSSLLPVVHFPLLLPCRPTRPIRRRGGPSQGQRSPCCRALRAALPCDGPPLRRRHRPPVVTLEPPDLTNALDVVRWFREVVENRQFQALPLSVRREVTFWAPPEEFVPTWAPAQAVAKISDALANASCLGYLEGKFGTGYALEVIVGDVNWEQDCPECSYASFLFMRDENGKFFLDSVEYVHEVVLQDIKATAAERSIDGKGLRACTDLRAEALQCGDALVSRIAVGQYAYVNLTPPLPNRVRQGASKMYAVIGYIQPGQVVKIIDGPVCADGWVWWKVKTDSGLVGWTAEGDAQAYWLVPCPGTGKCSP